MEKLHKKKVNIEKLKQSLKDRSNMVFLISFILIFVIWFWLLKKACSYSRKSSNPTK